jgi:hypothetical protein
MLMRRYKIEAYMKYVFGIAAISLAVPFLFHLDKHADKNGEEGRGTCGSPVNMPQAPQPAWFAYMF